MQADGKAGRVECPANARGWPWVPAALASGVLAVLAWSYWPTLSELFDFWQRNADYSVGELVPLVAAYLLWSDRKVLLSLPRRVCWWGLGVILLAQVIRFYGLYDMYGSLERYSIVLTVAGAVLFVLGFEVAWRLKWVAAFLLLMVPFPGRVHNNIAVPLQSFASSSAVFGLELMGYLVGREGNVLRVSDRTEVAVAEACSGLRMLTAFIVVAATLAFVVHRPKWQKAIVVLSSIPTAIVANSLRLIVTVLLFEYANREVAEKFFHDFAGICMMPFAVVAILAELWFMRFISGQSARRSAGWSPEAA